MADVITAPATNAVEASPSKKSAKKTAQSSRPKASHPPTAVMVTNAIKNLKERGGSSLQAIKKYISSTYKIDAEKLAPFIKKFIKTSVASGTLVQTKGKGASGSFKLSSGGPTKASNTANVTKVAKKPATKAPATRIWVERPAKKSPKKKAAKPKKAPAAEKKTVAPKPKVSKPKSPAKTKKAAKSPTKKPKSPKLKTTKVKAAAKSSKKAAPKKK